MSLSPKIQELVDKWLRLDKNPKNRAEIENLVKDGNEKELEKRLAKRIEFGTAGMIRLLIYF